jgi:hypothetical protein
MEISKTMRKLINEFYLEGQNNTTVIFYIESLVKITIS